MYLFIYIGFRAFFDFPVCLYFYFTKLATPSGFQQNTSARTFGWTSVSRTSPMPDARISKNRPLLTSEHLKVQA